MIDYLITLAKNEGFICDRCGKPDLLLGFYENCFYCENPLIRRAFSASYKLRFCAIKVLGRFIDDFDEVGPKIESLGMLESFARNLKDDAFSPHLGYSGLPIDFVRENLLKVIFSFGKVGGKEVGGYIDYNNSAFSLSLDDSHEGNEDARTIILLTTIASFKLLLSFRPSTQDKLQEFALFSQNQDYKKASNLLSYAQLLCADLNKHKFFHQYYLDGKLIREEYQVNEDDPAETIIGVITENYNACQFLNTNGLINRNICHFCGAFIDKLRYSFTEPKSGLEFPICKECFNKGR